MIMFMKLARWLAAPLSVFLFVSTSGIGPAHAGMIATDEVARAQSADADRARVISFLEREDVRRQMIELGVSPEEAAERVAALSDEELAPIVQKLDQLPAGGDALGTFIVVVAIIFLVLLFTDIMGVTNVFTFVR